jgi:hypothetical protein
MPPAAGAGLGDSAVVGPHLRAVLATVAALVVVVSCDKGSREDRFCDRLIDDQALLAVVPTDPDELDAFVERYQDLADFAPLAIEQQWRTITELVEAVATEDLTDPATADRLRDRAVAATRPIDEVRAYARTTCGVELVVAARPGAATTAPGATTVPGTTSTTLPAPGTVPPVAP